MQRSKSCAFSAFMCSRTVASRSFRRALGVKLRGALTSALSKARARLGLRHDAVEHKVGPEEGGDRPQVAADYRLRHPPLPPPTAGSRTPPSHPRSSAGSL